MLEPGADPENFLRGCGTASKFHQEGYGVPKKVFLLGENEYFPFRGGAAAPTAPPWIRP